MLGNGNKILLRLKKNQRVKRLSFHQLKPKQAYKN